MQSKYYFSHFLIFSYFFNALVEGLFPRSKISVYFGSSQEASESFEVKSGRWRTPINVRSNCSKFGNWWANQKVSWVHQRLEHKCKTLSRSSSVIKTHFGRYSTSTIDVHFRGRVNSGSHWIVQYSTFQSFTKTQSICVLSGLCFGHFERS